MGREESCPITKMKILYIAPYLNGTGYGYVSQNYILALDRAGINVVPRSILSQVVKPPERITELEKQSDKDCDIVVQHTLPLHMVYNSHFRKNIGIISTETETLGDSGWENHLNIMDEVFVSNKQSKECCLRSGVTKPIHVIPYAFDTSVFLKDYQPIDKLKQRIGNDFTFYTIGEPNRRKNLIDLIIAFHSEFTPDEPVSLVIKTGQRDISPISSAKELGILCNKIKEDLGLYRNIESYKKEIVITDTLQELDIYKLHNTCDCFVSPSYGESWCVPAFEAMAFGRTPIVTNYGGFKEYINNDTGWLVDADIEQCFGYRNDIFRLYTANNYWAKIKVGALRRCMRETYSNHELRSIKSAAGIDKAQEFSYELVSQQFIGLLT